jgi:hypothetical protein
MVANQLRFFLGGPPSKVSKEPRNAPSMVQLFTYSFWGQMFSDMEFAWHTSKIRFVNYFLVVSSAKKDGYLLSPPRNMGM